MERVQSTLAEQMRETGAAVESFGATVCQRTERATADGIASLKRTVNMRSQMFDMLDQIMRKYHETAKNVITGLGEQFNTAAIVISPTAPTTTMELDYELVFQHP